MAKSTPDRFIDNLRRVTSHRAFENARGRRVLVPGVSIALMFTDIEGFTPKAAAMGNDIIPVLNRYFSVMNECILENNGDIDKFIGDAIFAYFFDEAEPRRAADMAFDAALQMRRSEARMVEHDSEWYDFFAAHPRWASHKRFRSRIGLHWGGIVAGHIGSDTRADNTLIGDNVNLAARIEGLNKKYGCYTMLSEAFFEELSDDRRRQCRLIDRVTVAGRADMPLAVYTHDAEPFPDAVSELFSEALEAYFAGDWSAAHEMFVRTQHLLTLSGRPGDGPTQAMIERIERTNLFWQKAVQHLQDNVPAIFGDDIAHAVSEAFEGTEYRSPKDWPGHWVHDK